MIAKQVEITSTAQKYGDTRRKTYRMVKGKDSWIPRDPTYPLKATQNIALSAVKEQIRRIVSERTETGGVEVPDIGGPGNKAEGLGGGR